MTRRFPLIVAACLALCACGSQRELKPAMGHELPPAPYGGSARPTAAELLQPPTQAIPIRSEELRQQSEERQDDPFDLPPETRPKPKR